MRDSSRHGARRGRSVVPILWAALAVAALALGVWVSRVGVDVLLIAGAALFLFTMDRTVGDWAAEALGPTSAAVLFALGVIGFTWYIVGQSDALLAAAESHGYHGVFDRTATDTPPRPAIETGIASGGASKLSTAGRVVNGDGLHETAGGRTMMKAEGAPSPHASAGERPRATEPTQPRVATKSLAAAPSLLRDSKIVFWPTPKPVALTSTRSTLSLSSGRALPARRVIVQVSVTAQDSAVTEGTVAFIVNGSVLERVTLGSSPVASATFSTYIAGAYEFQARFSGTGTYAPSSSNRATLHVLPREGY